MRTMQDPRMPRLVKQRRDGLTFRVLHFLRVIVVILLLQPRGGQPQVVGPSQPVVVITGEDVILPCHLKPVMDASDMKVEWTRQDLSSGFIYMRASGREYLGHKQPSYRGRTSVSVDKLKLGDVSLKLSEVKVTDEGTYICLVPSLGRAAFIKLVVGAVSSPVIRLMSRTSSEMVLQCESSGWYPEPEVFWLDREGNLLSAGPPETVRGPDGLYAVSSRVTVEKTHSNNFTCRVQQKNINQTRETHIHVPVLPWYMKCVLAAGLISVILGAVFTVHGWRLRCKQLASSSRSEGPTECTVKGTTQTTDLSQRDTET